MAVDELATASAGLASGPELVPRSAFDVHARAEVEAAVSVLAEVAWAAPEAAWAGVLAAVADLVAVAFVVPGAFGNAPGLERCTRVGGGA